MTYSFWELPKRDQVFSYQDNDTGEGIHVAVSRLLSHLESTGHPVIQLNLDKNLVDHVMDRQGIEQQRLNSLTAEELSDPVIIAEWGENVHLPLDGNHRIVKRFQLGYNWAPAYLVTEELWRKFLVHDIPGTADEVIEFMTKRGRGR